MEAKSEFIQKVDATISEFQADIHKSEERKAVIIIASEPLPGKDGSSQTGAALGSETELVLALAGFMRQPTINDLIKKAAALNLAASMGRMFNQKEQEDNK